MEAIMSAKPLFKVNVHDAKTNLSKYLARVEAGETIVIARAGKTVAKLVPVNDEAAKDPRAFFGSMRGHGTIPDDFDRYMEDEIADMFEGSATSSSTGER
jgi:prevent-host-death family protein